MEVKFTLGKNKKLKSRTAIQEVYQHGSKKFSRPLRVNYRFIDTPDDDVFAWRVAFTVPKRLYKKAVSRNRIKRIMREALRLNQHTITIPEGKSLYLILNYSEPTECTSAELASALDRILELICQQ
jgi:ribonuclease P protein component